MQGGEFLFELVACFSGGEEIRVCACEYGFVLWYGVIGHDDVVLTGLCFVVGYVLFKLLACNEGLEFQPGGGEIVIWEDFDCEIKRTNGA